MLFFYVNCKSIYDCLNNNAGMISALEKRLTVSETMLEDLQTRLNDSETNMENLKTEIKSN